jgi:hypothetical protein
MLFLTIHILLIMGREMLHMGGYHVIIFIFTIFADSCIMPCMHIIITLALKLIDSENITNISSVM